MGDQDTPNEAAPPAEQTKPEASVPAPEKQKQGVLRTILDTEACRKVMQALTDSKAKTGYEHLVKEGPDQLAPLPKTIENCRKASPCPSRWQALAGSERVRFCEQCRLQVYDLASLSPEEADAIIFQREGTKPQMLYQRPDGKFLTRNCPVGLGQQRKTLLISLIACSCILLMLFIIAIVPKSPPPSETIQATSHPSHQVPTESASGTKAQPASAQNPTTDGWRTDFVPHPIHSATSPAASADYAPPPVAAPGAVNTGNTAGSPAVPGLSGQAPSIAQPLPATQTPTAPEPQTNQEKQPDNTGSNQYVRNYR